MNSFGFLETLVIAFAIILAFSLSHNDAKNISFNVLMHLACSSVESTFHFSPSHPLLRRLIIMACGRRGMAVIFATNRPRPGEITIGPSAVVSKIFWAEAMASQSAILCCECQATRTVASAAPSVSVEGVGLTKQSNDDF